MPIRETGSAEGASTEGASIDYLVDASDGPSHSSGRFPDRRSSNPNVAAYMRDIGRYPLLTEEQVRHLFEDIYFWRDSIDSVILTTRHGRRQYLALERLVDEGAKLESGSNILERIKSVGREISHEEVRECFAGFVSAVRRIRSPEQAAKVFSRLRLVRIKEAVRKIVREGFYSALKDYADRADDRRRHANFKPYAKWMLDFGAKPPEARALYDKMMCFEQRLQGSIGMVVDSNLRLVISIARKYHHHRLSLLDIVQEGNIGLMKAVECFDSRLGFHFSTYATWWITHAIRRAISDTGDTIRLPTHLREKLAKVRDYFDTHPGAEKRRDPEEIAAAVGMTVADARHALEADMLVYIDSLDRPMGYEPDSHSLMSQVEDAGSPRADAQVIEVDFVRRVREVVNSALDPREQRVIQLRFGEDDDVTLNEVGGMLGVTRERIRQIQEKALGKGGRALMRQLDPCIRDYGSLMGK